MKQIKGKQANLGYKVIQQNKVKTSLIITLLARF